MLIVIYSSPFIFCTAPAQNNTGSEFASFESFGSLNQAAAPASNNLMNVNIL